MITSIYLVRKYWKTHIKSMCALLFSAVLLTVVVLNALLIFRTEFARSLYGSYFREGRFDCKYDNISEELFAEMQEDSEIILGWEDIIDTSTYTIGALNDPHNLCNIEFEVGRMPEKSGEIAIAREVADRMYWLGDVGDSIEIPMNGDNKVFTVVGIIGEKYSQRSGSEVSAFQHTYGIPLIFISPEEASEYELIYRNAMTRLKISDIELYDMFYDDMYSSSNSDKRSALFETYDKYNSGQNTTQINVRGYILFGVVYEKSENTDLRLLYILATLAMITAVLSVYAVLRQVFSERKKNLNLLSRIGMSQKRIIAMLGLECACFIILQALIGIAVGIGVYFAIFNYQVSVMEMPAFSAFIGDLFVKAKTPNPFMLAAVFGAVVLLISYVLCVVQTFSQKDKSKVRPKTSANLGGYILKIFSQRTVTVIQTIALTVILCATMLGYMYYTDSGKDTPVERVYTERITYEIAGGRLDMEVDNIAEYYSASPPSILGIQSHGNYSETFTTADPLFNAGVNDEVMNKLVDAFAFGDLRQTLLVFDSPHEKYENKIGFSSENEREILMMNVKEPFKNFFEVDGFGTKSLYRCETKMVSKNVINALIPFVTAGKIDIDKIKSGEEIIAVQTEDTFSPGETFEMASVLNGGDTMIGEISTQNVVVGATVTLPDDLDNLLEYILQNDNSYYFLTTAGGAEALGLHNAAYTEIFSQEPIDSSLIPANAAMTLVSYSQLKHDQFIKKATEYGGIVLLIVLMALLGFSAYFNGIIMKIRLKSYQISVLRAIGTDMKRIRRGFFVDNLKIPLFSGAISFIFMKLIQAISYGGYQKLLAYYYEIIEKMGGLVYTVTDDAIKELKIRYFIEKLFWVVPLEIPLLIVLGVMCCLTLLLTILALKKSTKAAITSTLNQRRELL